VTACRELHPVKGGLTYNERGREDIDEEALVDDWFGEYGIVASELW
jgi:hypothetical protein